MGNCSSCCTVRAPNRLANLYIYASMPDRANLPRYQDNVPSGPWSIALRALGDDKVIFEGFGDSLNRPLVAENVSVRFGLRR